MSNNDKYNLKLLLMRALAGDERAWNEFFTAIRKYLHTQIRKLAVAEGSRPLDYSDLVQSALRRILEGIGDQFSCGVEERTMARFLGWAKTIVQNRGQDEFRRRQSQRTEPAGSDIERFADSRPRQQIVQIYEIGKHEGRSYLALEHVTGGSVAQHPDRYMANTQAAVSLVAKAARAVQHAHDMGIVHRDLKPANILVDEQGEPRISDFGLARVADSAGELTLSGEILGTPSYMAPEQARGEQGKIGPASDVYGLGGILYFLLTGRPPFQGASALDVLSQVMEKRPVPPRQLSPKVDRDLEMICLRCLEKDPARRYGTAADLADDLERWIRGEPITCRPRKDNWLRRLGRFFSFREAAPSEPKSRAPGA